MMFFSSSDEPTCACCPSSPRGPPTSAEAWPVGPLARARPHASLPQPVGDDGYVTPSGGQFLAHCYLGEMTMSEGNCPGQQSPEPEPEPSSLPLPGPDGQAHGPCSLSPGPSDCERRGSGPLKTPSVEGLPSCFGPSVLSLRDCPPTCPALGPGPTPRPTTHPCPSPLSGCAGGPVSEVSTSVLDSSTPQICLPLRHPALLSG